MSAQQPAADPEASRFTGQTAPLDAAGAVAGRRRFEPGARTAWHSHPRGQLLFVQEGRARIQKKGQSFRDFGPGESDFTGPDIVHWHGATPTSPSCRSRSVSAVRRSGWTRSPMMNTPAESR